jgi:hypothetical protein
MTERRPYRQPRRGGGRPSKAWNSYSYGQGQSTGGKNPAGLSPLFGA